MEQYASGTTINLICGDIVFEQKIKPILVEKALNIYFMEVSYAFDDQFVAAIPAFRFVGDNAPMPGSEQRAAIQKNLTDEDNPVLLFYTLKDPE